jgi:hypothetical protein
MNQTILRLDRIQAHTAPYINEKIRRQTETSVLDYAARGRDAVLRRLQELDYEYDLDRAVMINLSVVGGAALAAGYFHNKSWMKLVAVQLGFLFVHATYGWCPPVVLLRRMGFRTNTEIDYERRLLEELLDDGPGDERMNEERD